MKKHVVILSLLMVAISVRAQRETYLAYIEAWKDVVVQQQKDYGIPASITMAQALLESGAGRSELAVEANNHFGIKCTNEWMGGVYYYDDDSKGECFRHYKDAAESFKDHSLFLQRPRYESCFEIAIEDYEGWAYRLRQCGYATDPLYAQKLIRIIDDYRLDTLANKKSNTASGVVAAASVERPLKAEVVHKAEPIKIIEHDPEPPYVAPLTAKEEREKFFLSHPKKKNNGLQYVEAREGDTYSTVAFRLNIRERDLRERNDALGRDLKVGDRIYLQAKKNTGVNEYAWTYPGQSLWELCQEEGIKIEAVQKINGLDPSVRVFTIRQKIYMHKIKDENVR